MRLADIVSGPWAITPEMLHEIQGIYSRHLRGEKINLEMVEASLGRPLNSEPKGYELRDGVAILPIDGVIGKKMNLFTRISGGVSTDLVGREFDRAMADPQVKAVILAIDSPGGTIDGTPDLAEKVFRARGQGKEIIAFTDGTMASAAYWIGSAADAVYASNETNIVGSIGVVTSHTDYSRAEEQAGMKTTEIYAGKYKRIASEYAPLSDEGRAYIQSLVDHSYSVFVDAVAKHRGTTADDVLTRMADGKIHKGSQAINAGLVDGVSTLDELVARLKNNTGTASQKTWQAGSAAINPTLKETTMNIETLKADHPELVQAIIAEAQATMAEAVEAASVEGAAAERARIQSVEDACIPGHEALIASLKYDGKTTGEQAALQIIGAEKLLRTGALTAQQEANVAVPAIEADDASPAATAADAPLEDRARAQWDKDSKLRAEFGNKFETYLAYARNTENGRARILSK
jgi:signal peptide peptidase SppA